MLALEYDGFGNVGEFVEHDLYLLGIDVLSILEVKPTFNGGDANEFSKWVNSHLKYPDAAKAAGDQGRVLISFVVGSDGSVSDVKLLRGVSDELDAEALRVIKSSPKWEPGRQDGKAVPVTYTFPVTFKLK